MAHVSICIPTYKDERGLRRVFKSIEEQTYKDFDVYVTDDTPDDRVKEVFDSFVTDGHLNCDANIKATYIHNETSLGPAGNWNKAISLGTGEYIKILHQDDYFTFPDSLGSFVEMLDNNAQACMAFSGSRQLLLDANGEEKSFHDRHITEEQLSLVESDWHNLFLGGFIGAPSSVIYRNCDKRFDNSLSWLIDSDFYMNLLSGGQGFVHDDRPLITICESESQLTNSCLADGDLVLREHRHLFTKYNLLDSANYRRKLIQIAVDYKKPYSQIKDLNIPKEEYCLELSKKQKELRKFYVNLILRKLHLKK